MDWSKFAILCYKSVLTQVTVLSTKSDASKVFLTQFDLAIKNIRFLPDSGQILGIRLLVFAQFWPDLKNYFSASLKLCLNNNYKSSREKFYKFGLVIKVSWRKWLITARVDTQNPAGIQKNFGSRCGSKYAPWCLELASVFVKKKPATCVNLHLFAFTLAFYYYPKLTSILTSFGFKKLGQILSITILNCFCLAKVFQTLNDKPFIPVFELYW